MNLNQRISPNLSETPCKQQAQACSQGGFTLIELMVVIAILGILMAIGGTSWSSYRDATKVDSAKESVVSILQQARLKAISSGFKSDVQFDWLNNTVTYDGRIITMDKGVDIKGYKCTAPVVAHNAGVSTFSFKPRGTFGTAYTTPPANPQVVQVSSPSSNKVFYIKVNTTTGRVLVKEGAC